MCFWVFFLDWLRLVSSGTCLPTVNDCGSLLRFLGGLAAAAALVCERICKLAVCARDRKVAKVKEVVSEQVYVS